MTEQQTENNTAAPAAKPGNGGKKKAGIAFLLLLVAGTAAGLYWFISGKTRIGTDNAFVEAHVYPVSSRVAGTVLRVHVADNQQVKKGDLLAELDPKDFQVRLSTATAGLNVARNETSSDHAQVDASLAALAVAESRLSQADVDLKRGRSLVEKDVISKEQYDRLETTHRVAAAEVREAAEKVRKARSAVGIGTGGGEARIAQKAAQLDEARLQLSYTRIVAASDGYITRKSIEPGTTVQAGQPLMALVALDQPWVVANYKERQLTNVRPGQRVEFEVDAYPGKKFTGRVDSIMAGTGSAFSLLPPENATGNYVKVVQRIPVKIVIDPSSDPEHRLRVGMSVTPVILTGDRPSDVIRKMLHF